MWLAVCPLIRPPILAPSPAAKVGLGPPMPSLPLSFLILDASDPFLFLFGEREGRGLQYSVHVFRGFQCDDLGDRSLLTGSGAAQQPVTTVDQLGVHNATYLFRVTTGQRKKNDNEA